MAKFTFFAPTDMSTLFPIFDINALAENAFQGPNQMYWSWDAPFTQQIQFLGSDITYARPTSTGVVPADAVQRVTGGAISTVRYFDGDQLLWRVDADPDTALIGAADLFGMLRVREDSDFWATLAAGDDYYVGSRKGDFLIDRGGAGADPYSGSGFDTLDGGKGADGMSGGLDDDVYIVDHSGDAIFELDPFFDYEAGDAEQFIDTQSGGRPFIDENFDLDLKNNLNGLQDKVLASVSYTLPEYVDYLFLTGKADINATGNDNPFTPNVLRGNSGDNTLVAKGAAAWMNGGDGADVMVMRTTAGDSINVLYPDKVMIARGQSGLAQSEGGPVVLNAYDKIKNFDLLGAADGTGWSDQLDLPSTWIADNEVVNGANDTVSDGITLRSHSIVAGVIEFSTSESFSSGVTIDETNLKSALDYLSKNFNKGNHWGDTVIFDYTNTVNPVQSGTFVFTEGGTTAATSQRDTLVLLQGITDLFSAEQIWII